MKSPAIYRMPLPRFVRRALLGLAVAAGGICAIHAAGPVGIGGGGGGGRGGGGASGGRGVNPVIIGGGGDSAGRVSGGETNGRSYDTRDLRGTGYRSRFGDSHRVSPPRHPGVDRPSDIDDRGDRDQDYRPDRDPRPIVWPPRHDGDYGDGSRHRYFYDYRGDAFYYNGALPYYYGYGYDPFYYGAVDGSSTSYEVVDRRADEDQVWIEGHYEQVPLREVIEDEFVEVFHPAVYERDEDGNLQLLEEERTTREPKYRIVMTQVWVEGYYAPAGAENMPPPAGAMKIERPE